MAEKALTEPLLPHPRRRNRAGERRRQAVLEAAERLVLEHGHVNVTVQMVADAVEVSQPAVHHHFTTRDELFVELLRYRDAKSPEKDLPDAVEALIVAVRASESTPHLVALFADYSARAQDPQHPAHTFFRERYASHLGTLAAGIRTRQSAGTFADDVDAHDAAVALYALAAGLQTHFLIDPAVPMADELRRAIDRYIP